MTAPDPTRLESHLGCAPFPRDQYIENSIPAGLKCSESGHGFHMRRWSFWDVFFRRSGR